MTGAAIATSLMRFVETREAELAGYLEPPTCRVGGWLSLDAAGLADLLSLVVEGVAVEGALAPEALSAIAGWTEGQREEAARWAAAVHLDASDNHGIQVPPEPAHVLALRRALA